MKSKQKIILSALIFSVMFFVCSLVSAACTGSPTRDEMNASNCSDSNGTWNSATCVCRCPIGYRFEGTGCLRTGNPSDGGDNESVSVSSNLANSISEGTTSETATIPNPLTGINCLPELLQRVTDFVRNLALALMVPFVIWGGIVMITSSGNPEKVKEGRNVIIYTMVGVLVTFLANVLVDVVSQLFQAPGGNGCSYVITMFFA
ncbi:MAG: pilin [Candidatus Paceibacterota bacterium]